MNLKGNLTSKGLQGSIGKSRMQGILGTNPAAIPITVDNALSLSSTNPVQNRVITAAITNRLWSDEVKAALLQIVEKVAFIDEDGQDYYDALYDALYPPVGLDSIGAVFDSSATIYNTDTLDDLKQYLTVTAYYTSGDSEVVDSYTLSGSMDAGTQTITVSYGGKTTTFTVAVVEWVTAISAVFTQGQTVVYAGDDLDLLRSYLVVTATYADTSSAAISDYTLSGTLSAGTSSITATYAGKTSSFNVTVTDCLYNIHSGFILAQDNGIAPDYYAANDTRCCYPAFNILLDGGKRYHFQVTFTSETAYFAVHAFNQLALDAVANGNSFADTGETKNVFDSGWKGSDFNVDIPATINGSPIAGVRFTSKTDSAGSSMTAPIITRVIITEVVPVIPSTYQRVEYIQSSGNQAITTDIIPRNTRTLVTFEYTQFVGSESGSGLDNFVTGVYNVSNMRYLACTLDQYNQFNFKGRDNSYQWRGPYSPAGKHTVDFNDASHRAFYDGVIRATSDKFPITSGDNKLAIFARGHSSASSYTTTYGYCRVYYMRCENNTDGTVIGEFIPCYRKSDGEIGMYDTVSATFYTNVNSGDPFTKGSDV